MDKCKKCGNSLVPGQHFCTFCGYFATNPEVGKKAGLFKRWLAMNVIDAFIYGITLFIAMPIAWIYGTTPGHALLGLRIVKSDGSKADFGTMFIRSLGKIVSGLFFGLGFYWAIFDKDRQAWHDKMAGTYVVE
jgi:uncharacterized RDD family membrane protein YckC